jgi:type II secretory pathway predicted ATPase ExeA
MYHAHFGLERGLFDEGIAADAAVFRNAKHDRLIAHFKLALASASSCVVLHGSAGVGKTTLTSAALRASSTRLALAWLSGMPTNAAELLESILIELGIGIARTTRIERLQLWRQFQGEMRATDSRLFIVAERTEDLSPEVLHALDQLTAPDAVGNPGANLVLLGHAGIHEHLAAPALDSLRQRIRLRAELEPFTETELQDYLRHQATHAGGSYEQIFAPGSVAALYRYSNGVARLVNTLCESALDIAAVQHQKQLSPDVVARTAVSLLGLAEPIPVPRIAAAAAAAPVSAAPVDTRAVPRAAAASPPQSVVIERRYEPRGSAGATSPPPTRAAEPLPAPPPSPVRAAEPLPAPPPPASAPPRAPSAATIAPAPVTPAAAEFDGGATDIADVAVTDFPVLMDAVDPLVAPPEAQTVPAAPKPATPGPQAPAPTHSKLVTPAAAVAAAAPAPTKPAAKPVARVETAYAAARPATKPPPAAPAAPVLTPLPHAAAAAAAAAAAKPKAAAMVAPAAPAADSDDELRQTQSVRAIAEAKSIDDLSEIDAETLFSDAELDLVSAALASAAEWPDDDEPTAAPVPPPRREPAKSAAPPPSRRETAKAAAPAPARPAPAKAAAPAEEDPFDLFGLGDDAPLELIDDSTLPPNTRKRVAR